MVLYSYKLDSFDSKILHIPVAKITSFENSGKSIIPSVRILLNVLKQDNIKYATYRVNSNNLSEIQAFEKNGFIMVDGIISFELTGKKLPLTINSYIRLANEKDLHDLENIAGKVFTKTRFYNDSFTQKIASNVYREWIKNSVLKVAADEVFVYFEKEIKGFVTVKNKGEISLIGVKKNSQGKGIGKSLCLAAIDYLEKRNTRTIRIETQVNNISAIRTYLSCGFKPVESHVTLRWLNES